jgi:hypothetical protein
VSSIDHISLARSAVAAASQDVTPEVRRIHLGVARTSYSKARQELDALEISLKAAEGSLAIDWGGK